MYICVYGWYMPLKCAWIPFFLLKTWLFGLTLVSSDTTALTKSYFRLRQKIVREFLRKCCFSSHKKLL